MTSRRPCTCFQLTNPPGIELYYYANVFFCFGGSRDHVSGNSLLNAKGDAKHRKKRNSQSQFV